QAAEAGANPGVAAAGSPPHFPVPSCGHLREGAIVVQADGGSPRSFTAGQALIDNRNHAHRARNEGKVPMWFRVAFMGEQGKRNATGRRVAAPVRRATLAIGGTRGARGRLDAAPPQFTSSCSPSRRITAPHFSISARMKARNSSGVFRSGTPP